MSVNAAFSIFKPNPLYRNLRDDTNNTTNNFNTANNSSNTNNSHHDDHSHDGKQSVLSEDVDDLDDVSVSTLRDVDDTLEDTIRELESEKAELERRNGELRREKAELQRQRAMDSELATLVGELAAQKAELQAQNSELQRRNRQLEQQQNEQPAEREEERLRAAEWADEKQRLEQENDELVHQKQELQQRYDELLQQPRVDDELATLVDGLATRKDELETQNAELETEVDELYTLMEQMNHHIESLEAHQHSMIAYVNKVCNDVKNAKRRGVWQKIEFDKERQQIVEELYSWKRRAEELKAAETEVVAAAEATAAWEAACLNQTIEELQGQVLMLKTELDAAKEQLSRRGGSADEIAETEQMLEAVQELALDLKSQVDEANSALEKQKLESEAQINELRETMRVMKQRAIKQSVAHDKERQELVEELLMWKNREESHESVSHVSTIQDFPQEPVDTDTAMASEPSPDPQTHHDTVLPSVDNQQEHESAEIDGNIEESPLSTASESSNLADSVVSSGNQKDHKHESTPSEPRKSALVDTTKIDTQTQRATVATSLPALEDDGDMFGEFDEHDDDVGESALVTPRHSDSFFSRLRSFSFLSQTDSVSGHGHNDRESLTTPARSRANSTASSTTSTASSTTRANKPKKKTPPVTQHTQNDYLRKQEPFRMNSFKHFL